MLDRNDSITDAGEASPSIQESIERAWHDPGDPMGSHLGLIVLFNLGLGAMVLAAERSRRLPVRPSGWDVVLLGLGTYEISRLALSDVLHRSYSMLSERQRQPRARG